MAHGRSRGEYGGRERMQDGSGERLAGALGWLSLGVGLAQLAAPEQVARLIGMEHDDRSRDVLRAVGLRELASGVGILTQARPAGWAWARLGGDVMDLALLGSAMRDETSDRRRLAATTAAVAGVAALDFIAAQRLDRGTGRAIGRRAFGGARADEGVHVTKAITVNRPPDEVYRYWRNLHNLPLFMTHLESVQMLDERRSHWTASAPAGRTVEWDAEIIEDRPNQLIAWRSLPGADVSNAGIVRFSPAPGGQGTEVTVELRYDPPGGALGRVLAKLFGEEPAQQVGGDLHRFKQAMETGEVVHSDASIHQGMHSARPPAERF